MQGLKIVCVHGIAGIVKSAERKSGFRLKVTFSIAIQMQLLLLLYAQKLETYTAKQFVDTELELQLSLSSDAHCIIVESRRPIDRVASCPIYIYIYIYISCSQMRVFQNVYKPCFVAVRVT